MDRDLSPEEVLTATQLQSLHNGNRSVSVGGNRRLRVFMPADSPHINLCKSVMSAVALGYPAPVLLNWKGEFNRPDWHLAGSHIAKLESFLSVIEDMLALAEGEDSDVSEDDLAVLVDAYDVWFQLPPSVLIERYHSLNREADKRVREQWEAASGYATNFPVESPKQSIIVTSAKDCQPSTESGSDPHYSHWPESPMPTDLYGPRTDQVLSQTLYSSRMFSKIRPRCINTGMVMGTMGSLRDALRRTKTKVERTVRNGRQLWSDQALLAELMGEQEIWREWMREMGASWNGTVSVKNLSKLPHDIRSIGKASLDGQRFEYGIGLDYSFSTIPPTCSAEEDGAFVKMSDIDGLEKASQKAGVQGDLRVQGVPTELKKRSESVGPASLASVKWKDEPLYTDLYFGVTPVGIHHNAFMDNLKPRRLNEWWSKMWFFPHLRRLLEENIVLVRSATLPLARIAEPESDEETLYWAPKADMRSKMVKVFEPSSPDATSGGTYTPIYWDGVCQGGSKPWHEEIFQDGQGPWQL